MPVSELIVYQACWSPHSAYTYAAVSQDGVFQLWDMQASNSKPQIYLAASEGELLCLDWAKYTPNLVVTGGSDAKLKGWDLRSYSQPLFELLDHGHAVKRVQFSPFHPTTFASVSYDMTLR
jgi:peroxin-7